MIIYKAKNHITGQLYIGQTTQGLNNRIAHHIKSSNKGYFPNALRLYGIQSFEFFVLDVASSQQDLDEKEIYWIKFFNSKFPNGYNLTNGGNGGPCSEEVKHKLSLLFNPLQLSEETRKKIKAKKYNDSIHGKQRNQEYMKQYNKQYRIKNAQDLKEKRKQRNQKNKKMEGKNEAI